jgi:hypothetical protein
VAATGSRIMTARLTADDRADLLAAAEESLDRLAHLSAPQATVPASGSASRQPAAWPRR